MNNRKPHSWIALLLVAALIMLTGCQSVDGLDLNKVMKNSYSIQSAESKQTIALEITPNPAAETMTEEDKKAFELFSNVQLTISEAIQQDYTHISIKGVFEYNKGKIPFQLTISDQDYTILVEGAKKPIVIHNNGALQELQAQQGLSKEMEQLIKQTYQKIYAWYPSFGGYLAGLIPNVNKISVSSASEMVGTEGLKGKNIHVELKGSELIELTRSFLKNLLADDKGLKEMLGQIYDIFVPIVQQVMKENQDASGSYSDMISPYLNNKTLAVELAYTYITSNLKQTIEYYDTYVKELSESYSGEALKVLLSDKFSVKTDVFVDGDLMPRKSSTEVLVNMPDDNTTAVKSVKLTTTAQTWNINKPVKAAVIDTSAGQIEMNSFNKPNQLLAALDPKSSLYELLKYDLHITKKDINLLMDNYSGFDDTTKPFYRNGVIMVPARFVVEELDAEVNWNAANQQVTVTDPSNGVVIKLNVGSKQATVNGLIKPLEVEAELKDGTTYVPVRFIAESLGATVKWNSDMQMVTISRE
ncbi:copper amine oxidase N-terminal domain-containing protein [Paenibacillus sp. WQ 127069]|uniref:Copper amine oxidase N-terminal domain-containing protein n=1 Tax=Paenibacillus baimaensis TaxID=2982185 RepID=A0ABT2UQ54_9BACL|nr:copper amine oxidase N-terminal domain-containing protein [Paenibacillus sp. WQ 127069]MCU6796788.1 copper amine oxidase N-terminal domain-containing protein [Paenibacillus sp. WQ 127069]